MVPPSPPPAALRHRRCVLPLGRPAGSARALTGATPRGHGPLSRGHHESVQAGCRRYGSPVKAQVMSTVTGRRHGRSSHTDPRRARQRRQLPMSRNPAPSTRWHDRHTDRSTRTSTQPRRSEPWYQRAEAEEKRRPGTRYPRPPATRRSSRRTPLKHTYPPARPAVNGARIQFSPANDSLQAAMRFSHNADPSEPFPASPFGSCSRTRNDSASPATHRLVDHPCIFMRRHGVPITHASAAFSVLALSGGPWQLTRWRLWRPPAARRGGPGSAAASR